MEPNGLTNKLTGAEASELNWRLGDTMELTR